MISVWLQFSPHPPTQQRCADVVRAPAHCHAEASLFFFFFFFSFGWKTLQEDACGSAGTTTQKFYLFIFWKGTFPPCGRFVKATEEIKGEKTGIYIFSDALGRELPGPSGDKGRPQVARFSEKCCMWQSDFLTRDFRIQTHKNTEKKSFSLHDVFPRFDGGPPPPLHGAVD